MEIPPGVKKVLDAVGVNTTRLQWKLYQREKRKEERAAAPSKLPTVMRWWNYPHKFCLKCNALNDREASNCHRCGARLPSMLGYKIFRTIGVVLPAGGGSVIFAFEAIMVLVFALMIAREGFSVLGRPTIDTTIVFGSYYPAYTFNGIDTWRALGFAFVHGGLLHIFFNLFCLFQVGPMLEAQTGPKRMLVIITVTQIAAAIGTYIWYIQVNYEPYASTVGASGFLFGLIGFAITYFRSQGSSGAMYRQFFIRWAIYAGIFGLIIGANNAAHFGGLIGGLILGMLPLENYRNKSIDRFWNAAFVVSAALWLITIGFLVYSIFMYWTPREG